MDKQKYIKKLMNFIDDNDPSKHISYLARNDSLGKSKIYFGKKKGYIC